MPPNEADAGFELRQARRQRFGEDAQMTAFAVPIEVPVNIVYAPLPYAVMMATPADLEDFAVGFSLTEGVIASAADIRSIVTERAERGLRLIVELSGERMRRHLARTRNLAGRTGCGVCGIDDLAALPLATRKVAAGLKLSLSAVRLALSRLEPHQSLNARTHAVHAAVWCSSQGEILVVREDVGRHNALDKLIGALFCAKVDPKSGFMLITSRCSFEMVEKTATFGARALVAVSAPTSLAIQRAETHGMTLLAVARADGATIFAGGDGVIDDLRFEREDHE